ncbi:MAG TPA: transposase [Verrucomicrobiota bacterium]|nr:transposase [Verrucomicrobiota bacterium]
MTTPHRVVPAAQEKIKYKRQGACVKEETSRRKMSTAGLRQISSQELRRRVHVDQPRLRKNGSEVQLPAYLALHDKKVFSDQLLGQMLAGLSERRCRQTLVNCAEAIGVSASAVSERVIEASSQKLRQMRERRFDDFMPFAVFVDTVHRGGMALVVAVGLDVEGNKRVLGFWEGATEIAEVVGALFDDLQSRGLRLSRIVFLQNRSSGESKLQIKSSKSASTPKPRNTNPTLRELQRRKPLSFSPKLSTCDPVKARVVAHFAPHKFRHIFGNVCGTVVGARVVYRRISR